MYPIAAIDFATGPMAALSYVSSGGGPNAGNISGYSMPSYEGASQPLTRLALATAMQGAIPNIPSPAENSSYRLDFDAPGVQCEAISVDILDGFTAVMNCSVIRGESSNDICPSSYYYMAWPPSTHAIIPFGNDSLRFGTGPWLVDSNVGSYGPYGNEPGAIFVAVDTQPPYGLKDAMVVLNCSLWNATYTVDFNFPAEGQRITILHAQYNQPVSVGVLDAFPYNTPLDLSAHGPQLSYQALMECLGNILVGRYYTSGTDGRPHESGAVLQTDLAYSKELFPMYKSSIAASDKLAYNATVAQAMESRNFGRPLGILIEEMFQNMTLALFSQQVFLHHGALPTNVRVRSARNEYSYAPSRLLLAYGLAVGFSLAIVVLGIASLWLSGASYSNKFSTVMRTTCDADMCADVASVDRTGADPLPKYLEKLEVRAGIGLALPTDPDLAEPLPPTGQKRESVSREGSGLISPGHGQEACIPADRPAEPEREIETDEAHLTLKHG